MSIRNKTRRNTKEPNKNNDNMYHVSIKDQLTGHGAVRDQVGLEVCVGMRACVRVCVCV